jgi:peptidoglycan/LPS O-acetylase OafA/YrhL
MHWRKILLGAGLMQVAAAIAITWWFKNDVVLHALAWTMLPLGFACCIPSFITLRDPGNAFAGLVRYLSTRSYGLYIVLTFVFYALMAVQKGYAPAWLFTMTGIVPALLAAELSYRFIEMPILRRRPKQFVRARHVSEQPSKPDAFDAKGWHTHGPAPA